MWTLTDALRAAARNYADKTAIVDGNQRTSYQALAERVDQATGWLQDQGVTPGERIGLQGRNTLDWIVAFYAIVGAGAVAVPINHKLAPAETSYILQHSGARLWLVDADLHHTLDGAPPAYRLGGDGPLPRFAPAEACVGLQARPVARQADDLAELLYTSGTTGRPKGCMHSHASVLHAGTGSSLIYGMGQWDTVLIAMPIWHSFPLNNLLVGGLYVGATLVLLPEYHPAHFLKAMQDERCTLFFGAPIAYLMALRVVPDFDQYDLSNVRAWLYGGGPIDAATARLLTERYCSDRFYQVFGMTETGPTGTALLPHEQIAKAGSIGRRAVPGCVLKVMRDQDTEAGPGETGEIWLRCQSMMQGYYQDEAATVAAFQDGWYRSGDLARIDADGYLYIVDRLKDMIVTGGENVYSKEVEDALASHPDVAEVAVIGEPHAEWGETVVALVVLRPERQATAAALQAHSHEQLARYKVPRRVHFVESLPRTPTGKVMKYQLRQTR